MKDIFDFKRFGNYFLYDLKNAQSRFLISLLVLGCLPVITFFFGEIFHLIGTGSWDFNYDVGFRVFTFVVASLITILVFPGKVYGGLTDKRRGSDWVLIPASVTEKFVSMVLIVCVVLPVCLFAILFGADALMSLFFPHAYGAPLPNIDILKQFSEEMSFNSYGLEVNIDPTGLLICYWFTNILAFTLGAVFFKKSKVAKTFLVAAIIGMLFSSLISIFFTGNMTSLENMIESMNAVELFKTLNVFLNVSIWLEIIVLLVCLYLRLKTIKH